MIVVAWILSAVATLATAYIAKLIVVDIGWHDLKGPFPSRATFVVCMLVGLGFVAGPVILDGWLIGRGHTFMATLAAAGTIAVSFGAFNVVSAAFRP